MPVDFPIPLQTAYDVGNEIQLTSGRPLILESPTGKKIGMSVEEPITGVPSLQLSEDGYGLSISPTNLAYLGGTSSSSGTFYIRQSLSGAGSPQIGMGNGASRNIDIDVTNAFISALIVRVDSDVLTGSALVVRSGPSSDKDIFQVGEDGVLSLGEITGTYVATMNVDPTADRLMVNSDIVLNGSTVRSIYGGTSSSDALHLQANTASLPSARLDSSAGSIILNLSTNKTVIFEENSVLFASTGRSGTLFEMSGTTGGTAVEIRSRYVTTGRGASVSVDNDVITTGRAFTVLSGPSAATDVFNISGQGIIEMSAPLGTGRLNPVYMGCTANDVLEISANVGVKVSAGHMDMTGGSGYWFRPPSMTTAEETTMTSGWAASDAGKMWYNTTLNAFRGWDGTQVVTL